MGSWSENQRAVTNHSAAWELKGESGKCPGVLPQDQPKRRMHDFVQV